MQDTPSSLQNESKAQAIQMPVLPRQERYRQAYRRRKPSWHDCWEVYRDVIDGYVREDARVLDIGCGHGDVLRDIYARTPYTYGVDPDADALKLNTIICHTRVGTADSLPFEDNFFDLAVSAFVLEHLADPISSFREIHRVLKPGGKVVFLTPNTWNYNVWIIRAIPNRFHDFLTRRLYRRQEHDTFPVRYRVNSARRVDHILLPLGFREVRLIFNGDPSYISFNQPLFNFACLLEALLDRPALQRARVHMIGIYEKK